VPWDADRFVLELHAAAGTERHWVLLDQLSQFR
jgi:hypothetical protein